MKKLIAILFSLFFVSAGHADDFSYEGPEDWESFDQFMLKQAHEDEVIGLSYLVSGVLATVGGNIGYYSSEDSLSRGAYALTQSAGILAIGYGASIYWNGNDFESFYRAVKDSHLTQLQKTEVLQRFLRNEKEKRDRAKWIQMGTFTLLAAVNFYSASREEDKDVRKVFQFLGGVNLLLALSYAF